MTSFKVERFRMWGEFLHGEVLNLLYSVWLFWDLPKLSDTGSFTFMQNLYVEWWCHVSKCRLNGINGGSYRLTNSTSKLLFFLQYFATTLSLCYYMIKEGVPKFTLLKKKLFSQIFRGLWLWKSYSSYDKRSHFPQLFRCSQQQCTCIYGPYGFLESFCNYSFVYLWFILFPVLTH